MNIYETFDDRDEAFSFAKKQEKKGKKVSVNHKYNTYITDGSIDRRSEKWTVSAEDQERLKEL